MNYCLCIIAWHNNPGLFGKLIGVKDLAIYVISHQVPTTTTKWLCELFSTDHVFYEPNIGYDWGGYQQFITKRIYQEYPFIFFAHDDISILDTAVFEASAALISTQSGNCIIGNGRPTTKRDWPLTHIFAYAHSYWKPPSWEFQHDVVRGSFWGTSREAMDRIDSLEVLWDRHRLFGVGAGNWSLKATCGKIQAVLGENAFQYLSETYLSSSYITELERGVADPPRPNPTIQWRLRYYLIRKVSEVLMTWYMNNSSRVSRHNLASTMQKMYAIL